MKTKKMIHSLTLKPTFPLSCLYNPIWVSLLMLTASDSASPSTPVRVSLRWVLGSR